MEEFECIELDQQNDGVTVYRLVDNRIIDSNRIQQLGVELFGAVEKQENDCVLLNLENVQFLSSSAINKLIVLEKRARSAGKQIKLSNLRPEVKEIFNITNLHQLFDVCENQEEALKSFESKT
jgi:anti-sigma B factor antagonist